MLLLECRLSIPSAVSGLPPEILLASQSVQVSVRCLASASVIGSDFQSEIELDA